LRFYLDGWFSATASDTISGFPPSGKQQAWQPQGAIEALGLTFQHKSPGASISNLADAGLRIPSNFEIPRFRETVDVRTSDPKRQSFFAVLKASLRWHAFSINPLLKPPGARLRSIRDQRWKTVRSQPLPPTWIK
jgi:hypothetical protein